MNKVKLQILTPEKNFFEGEVQLVVVKGVEGSMGIMYDHEPFVTPLGIGPIKILQDNRIKHAAISQGYVEVMEEKIVILADTAEWPEDIDISRAEEAKKRAEKRLSKKENHIELLKAEIALKKAINRINVAKMPANHK
ncbi:MAG TPA: F0F1 ATP synthase subunit epsilon [Clostridiales bacterium]|jgi:F-type H+-transporting ATPase subunit epsilon|nr:F0F1 ATP synthase subunit epsilon [Clostridiales bacterium]